VELLSTAGPQCCDACGQQAEQVYNGFRKEKFAYDIEGLWPHPHSPKRWDIKKRPKTGSVSYRLPLRLQPGHSSIITPSNGRAIPRKAVNLRQLLDSSVKYLIYKANG
jgi:hypothetical protein